MKISLQFSKKLGEILHGLLLWNSLKSHDLFAMKFYVPKQNLKLVGKHQLMPSVRMVKTSMGGLLVLSSWKDLFANVGGWLANLLAFLNLPLSNDLIRYD